jgi:hypothetical protein
MKKITLNDNTYLFVEVSDDAKDFKLNEDDFSKIIIFETQNNIDSIEITKENYQIISTTEDIAEEQAGSFVDKKKIKESWNDTMTDVYINYEAKELIGKYVKTAKESLQSLIQANGLDINKNYLILKQL